MTTTGPFKRSLWSSSSRGTVEVSRRSCSFLFPPSHRNSQRRSSFDQPLRRNPSHFSSRALHHHTYRTFDETNEVYDPSILTTPSRQRQQQAAPNPAFNRHSNPSVPLSAVLDSPHSLRRTSRYSHRRPGSVDASGRPFHIEQTIPVLVRPIPERTSGIAAVRPALSEARTENEDQDTDSDENAQRPGESYWPRLSTRVSSRTASAILWALEEAIRKPFPFTPDLEEVNAPMSDLGGIPGPSTLGGNGRTQNGASRAAQGPVPVNPHPASGVRTPTDIMRQRRDREARRKAEQDARNREQEEVERRRQQQQQQETARTQSSSQTYAAGVAGDRPSQRRAVTRAPGAPEPKPETRATAIPATSPTSSRRLDPQTQTQISSAATGPPQTKPVNLSASQQQNPASAAIPTQQTQTAPTGQGATSQSQNTRRVAFPHAFERWETLSSHWEGLTGYWIRKLEQNNEALERDPLSQQMARQVTDLSAAGANLFHAVVELQRLRASSERKFQRWFFDTRAEQERSKELQADLERQIQAERQARADSTISVHKAESDRARAEELLKEMRRELQISKEEARRAWEELGRREQEERDRTNSLRNGEPTLVGGVQVVPMVTGLPSRQNISTRPSTRDGSYAGGDAGARSVGGTPDHFYGDTPASPTVTDPFVESQQRAPVSDAPGLSQSHQPTSTTAPAQGQHAGQYYNQEDRYPARTTAEDPSYRVSAASSNQPTDEEYPGYRRNPQDRPIVYPPALSEESDDYDQESLEDRDLGYATTTMPTSSGPLYATYEQGSVDYSGSDWGVGTGWESLTPRHRHPTRLSDVLEEEEPRTTPSRASRASQASRSVH